MVLRNSRSVLHPEALHVSGSVHEAALWFCLFSLPRALFAAFWMHLTTGQDNIFFQVRLEDPEVPSGKL